MNRKDAIGVMLDKYDKLTVDYNSLINEQNVDYSILQKNTADEFFEGLFCIQAWRFVRQGKAGKNS